MLFCAMAGVTYMCITVAIGLAAQYIYASQQPVAEKTHQQPYINHDSNDII